VSVGEGIQITIDLSRVRTLRHWSVRGRVRAIIAEIDFVRLRSRILRHCVFSIESKIRIHRRWGFSK
jgi:hypothetical protein